MSICHLSPKLTMAVYLLFLIISASAFSTLNADVSINCGASESFTDDYTITWEGDDFYINHGDSVEVQSSNSVYHPMTTLRVFKERKKSCYSIDTEKGSRVLVRASFFYGNYDGKSSPPSFNLQFDGNHWTKVETSLDEVVTYEIIYVTKTDTISVCVAQTSPNMFPFISAVEVRTLDTKAYGHYDSNYALMLTRRVAFGTKDIIRYPDDVYDRRWIPANNGAGFTVLTSDESSIDVNLVDNPPQAVFQNAFSTNSTSTYISLGANLPTTEVPIYMNMYFSEVSILDSTDKRSFAIYIDDERRSDFYAPVYAKAGEKYITNCTASSKTTFSLIPSSDSTLPPLINALEVFTISDKLTDGTNSEDVEGLASIRDEFDVLGDWRGDPCLPSPYSWDWINCTSGSTPRVTQVHLGSYGLSGFLPDFSSMTALEIIDFHNNSLIGSIPEFLGNLPNLKQLNLANNDFHGEIPYSISKNTKLKLIVTGNPSLCVSGKSCEKPASSSSRGNKKSKLPIILGAAIPAFALLWVVGGVFAVLRRKRKLAAIAAGQVGGATVSTGPPPPHEAAKMEMHAANNIAPNLVNEFRVNIQEPEGQQSAEVPVNHHDGRY